MKSSVIKNQIQIIDHMQANSPIQMPEIEFNNLQQPPPLDQNLLQQINNMFNSSNWIDKHQCITGIRSINKFFPQFTPDVINQYSQPILQLISKNAKPQILKNVYKLLKEIYSIGKNINVEKAVVAFVPELLKKASTDIGHIKDMAQEVLTIFSLNCGYEVSFLIAAQYACDKNAHIAQISLKLLAKLIQTIGNSFTLMNTNTLQTIMKALSAVIDGKRANMKTWALDICMFIYSILGQQNYFNLMNFSLTQEQIQSMGSSMQTHRTQKNKQVPISNLIKQQRKTMKFGNQNCNSNNFMNGNNYNQALNMNNGNMGNSNNNFTNYGNYGYN